MDSQRDARAALERYRLHGIRETGKEFGRGSYAAVVEVDFKGLRCAGKKIHRVLYEQGVGDLVRRFEEECRLLSELRHPHIVQFLGIYFDPETDDVPVLVMEFLPTTLAQCLERYGVLPEEITYSILHDVGLGLRYLHERPQPIVHRDLSANNVLLTSDMRGKISDLGVAKIFHLSPAQMSRMTRGPGTPSYMPPEALAPNPRYDIKVDIFSYGVMMVHVFSGRWPLPGEAVRVNPSNEDELIPVSEADRREEYLDDLGHNHPLRELIFQCLKNSPSRRPEVAGVVRRVSEAGAQFPPSFANRVELLQRIRVETNEKNSLRSENETLRERKKEVEKLQLAERNQLYQQVTQLEQQLGSGGGSGVGYTSYGTSTAKELQKKAHRRLSNQSFDDIIFSINNEEAPPMISVTMPRSPAKKSTGIRHFLLESDSGSESDVETYEIGTMTSRSAEDIRKDLEDSMTSRVTSSKDGGGRHSLSYSTSSYDRHEYGHYQPVKPSPKCRDEHLLPMEHAGLQFAKKLKSSVGTKVKQKTVPIQFQKGDGPTGLLLYQEIYKLGGVQGALVTGVTVHSRAYGMLKKGDIQLLDIIVKMNRRLVTSLSVFGEEISKHKAIDMVVDRSIAIHGGEIAAEADKQKATHIFLLMNPHSSAQEDFGLTVSKRPIEEIVVQGVAKGSVARLSGIKFNDVIVAYALASQEKVEELQTSFSRINEVLGKASTTGKSVILFVKRPPTKTSFV